MTTQPLPQPTRDTVIIGAGYAGLMTALRLGRRGLPVTLINPTDQFIERIRLHQVAVGQRIPAISIRRLIRGLPIRFIEGRVTALDPTRNNLTIETISGTFAQPYHWLVYALGSAGRAPEHAYTLDPRSLPALQTALKTAEPGARVLIVGAGLTGLEAATEIAEQFPTLSVMLATDGSLNDGLSERGTAYLREVFARLGVHVRENTLVESLQPGSAALSGGEAHPFDVCVWTAGFGVSDLARNSGIATNEAGQIQVDSSLRSRSHPNIFAVGDSAQSVQPFGALRMACATALPMGAHTADSLTALSRGGQPTPFRFAYVNRCISLGRRAGLIQFTHADDSPRNTVLTGRAGAIYKEVLCQFVRNVFPLERRIPGAFRWPQHRPTETAANRATIAQSGD